MPNPIKYFEHGELYLVTSRTEEGLPFKNSLLYSVLFEAILARALFLYPVHIIGFTLEANHLHLLLCVINPEHLPLFVGYVKQELAHATNRFRGRKKKTVWCEGYDSPVLLGEKEALHYLTYIYTQARSNRTSLCNSWDMFSSGTLSKECKRRHRSSLKTDSEEESHILTLSPFAWIKTLCPERAEGEIRDDIVKRVMDARSEGRITSFDPIEAENPENDDLYIPKKRGMRMFCICWNIERRKAYLEFIRASIEKCREVLTLWRKGHFEVMWPPGFFPPSAVRRANLIPD